MFSLGLALPSTKPGSGQRVSKLTADFKQQTGFDFTGIDVLNVSVGTAKFIDLKDQRQNRAQKIGLENCVIKNVKTGADLLGLELLVALRGGDVFGSLAGLPGQGPPGN